MQEGLKLIKEDGEDEAAWRLECYAGNFSLLS